MTSTKHSNEYNYVYAISVLIEMTKVTGQRLIDIRCKLGRLKNNKSHVLGIFDHIIEKGYL